MSDNTLATKANGNKIKAGDVNQYFNALKEDLVPRNSSGAPTDEEGSLGTSTYKWSTIHAKDINVVNGSFFCGQVIMFHDFGGTLSPGQGWMKMDGSIVNETNYDAIHGAGSWATYIGTSPIGGKYLPDQAGKTVFGTADTSQTGAAAITSEGNAGHSIVTPMHTHTAPNHRHRWYRAGASNASDKTYDIDGNFVDLAAQSKSPNQSTVQPSSNSTGLVDSFTSDPIGASSTGSSGEMTLDVQNEGHAYEFWMRII